MHDVSTPAALSGPIQLHWDGVKVVVMPADQSRLAPRGSWSGLLYPLDLAAERFWRQLAEEFLPAVRKWCEEHQDKVAACYVPLAKDHLKVFVLRKSVGYDFTLSDDVTDLETRLFEMQWPAEILQLPNGPQSTLEAFFKPAASIEVYANRC
jgi:hypothetical protein